MSNTDEVRFKGSGKEYKDDRGGATLIPSAVVGIVKNNIDPTRSGRLEVFIKRLGSTNPDKPAYWTTVRYLSPFFGNTPNTAAPQGYGDYVGNPNSYGFWATPPDIGTEVICVFLNGDPNEGYYIGSIPKPGLTHMTPAIGASDSVIPNKGEAESYGGATRLPVSEINNANEKQSNNPTLTNQPRPIHSYQAAIYNKQGLLRDPDRGPISSSSVRESPSRVFGMSTPGRPIYQGGYDDASLVKAIADNSIPDKNFQVIGRTGGHSFVMDDGDITGKDQLIRLRTATGHTILMNDAAQTLFIIHANGQSYIELGKEGTIDMYSTNSVNIRTQGDLNLHADRNININAGKDLNINAENVQIESEKATNMFTGTNFSQSVKGSFTNKVEGGMSHASSGPASFASSGTTYINGPSAVNLNTGSSGLVPKDVKQVAKVKHTDTLYDEKKGFAAAPGKLTSITSRAPAHAPWLDANKGVDAKTTLSASANFPPPASSQLDKINQSAPPAPLSPATPTVVTTVPNVAASNATNATSIDKPTSNALVSQMAVNAATNPITSTAVKQSVGTLLANGSPVSAIMGSTGLTPEQVATSGHIKPGMEVAINAAIASGNTLENAMPATVWTGKDGVNSLNDFIKNQNVQVSATQTLLDKSKTALVSQGLLTGNESPTQASGLILATASAGVGPVTDYVKTVANVGNNALGTLTSALPPGTLNPVAGSISNLIAGGKMAAGLADKVMGGLAVPGTPDTPEGVSKGLFSKITDGFKALKAGIPQNLTSINAKNKAEQESGEATSPETSATAAADASAASKVVTATTSVNISETLSKAFNAVQSGNIPGVSGINTGNLSGMASAAAGVYAFAKSTGESLASGASNLPGGTSGLSQLVQGNLPTTVPGTADIKKSLSAIGSAVSGTIDGTTDVVNGLKDKLKNSSLASFASAGLSQNDLAKLNGSINSISAGGAQEIKLPTFAEGTNDTESLQSQSRSLLGNDKIPNLSFGSFKPKILSPAETAKYDKLKSELDELEDTRWDLRKVYLDFRVKYGSSATETISAQEAYDKVLADIDKIKQQMAEIATS